MLHDRDGAQLGEFPTDGSVGGLRRALDQIDDPDAAASVTLRRPTLDDVFLSLTGAPRDDARIPQQIA